VIFQEEFFTASENLLTEMLPEYESLDKVLRVIDIQDQTGGQRLHVLMNADLDKAMGLLAQPGHDNFFSEDESA